MKITIMKWSNNLKERMEWYDFSFIKISSFFATLFLLAAFPAFLEFVLRLDWYWYLVLSVIFSIPVLRKMF